MNAEQSRFENIWAVLLSRDAKWILAGFESLQSDQKRAVLEHLRKMVGEPGWQPEQRISAQIALDAIHDNFE